MYKPMLRPLVLLACITAAGGCLPKASDAVKSAPGTKVQAQATPGKLADELKKMAANPEMYSDTPDRHIVTRTLNDMGPTALAPLVDYMGAPDTPAKSRLFILQCVADYMSVAYMPNLKPLLESKDPSVRAIGVTALGQIKDPSSVQLLMIARKDASPNVSFSALSGLAMQGDPAARQELRSMYNTNSTIGPIPIEQVKREVVRVLLRDSKADDLPILQDALNQPFIAINARFMIVETLGRLGDKSVVPLLEKSLNLQKEPEYGEMVKQAIATINQRFGSA